MISLLKTRQDPCRYSIKCNNPSCKLSIMINPELIKDIKILSEHCPRCSSFLNISIPLLSITFHSTTQLSSSMSNPYKVCLTAHDEVIRHYGFINNHPVDMSTRPFTATEVNELANHKSQSTHINEETTVNVSQLAWLAPVSSATKSKLVSQPTSLLFFQQIDPSPISNLHQSILLVIHLNLILLVIHLHNPILLIVLLHHLTILLHHPIPLIMLNLHNPIPLQTIT